MNSQWPAVISALGSGVITGAAAMGMDGEPLLDVVRHRAEQNWRCPPAEFERYLDAVARTATFLDQLQLGDQR